MLTQGASQTFFVGRCVMKICRKCTFWQNNQGRFVFITIFRITMFRSNFIEAKNFSSTLLYSALPHWIIYFSMQGFWYTSQSFPKRFRYSRFRYSVNKKPRRRPFFRYCSEFRYLGFRYSSRYLYSGDLFVIWKLSRIFYTK